MKILMTNDDGVHAIGITSLAKELAKKHEVVVVAPDRERSAAACCLTVDMPLRYKEAQGADYENIEGYAVSGTPVDCVKLALANLTSGIDLVVSGINIGSNLGSDINYSGTVGAALEACMEGYPALAFSQIFRSRPDKAGMKELFAAAAETAAAVINGTDISMLDDYILNVNIPHVKKKDIKGIVACGQGILRYEGNFKMETDLFGRQHFWLGGRPQKHDFNSEFETDVKWIEEGYVTVSPLTWNLTMRSALERTKCNIEKIKLQNE